MVNISCISESTGNNGTFINNGPVTIASNGTVPLTTNSVVNGTDITHTPGSDSIFLSPSKTYFAYYKCTTPSGGDVFTQFLLNGMIVNGSVEHIVMPGGFQTIVTNGVIINTPCSPVPILKLQNASSLSKVFREVTITIFRLS